MLEIYFRTCTKSRLRRFRPSKFKGLDTQSSFRPKINTKLTFPQGLARKCNSSCPTPRCPCVTQECMYTCGFRSFPFFSGGCTPVDRVGVACCVPPPLPEPLIHHPAGTTPSRECSVIPTLPVLCDEVLTPVKNKSGSQKHVLTLVHESLRKRVFFLHQSQNPSNNTPAAVGDTAVPDARIGPTPS